VNAATSRTYSQSAEGIEISHARMLRELAKHGADSAESVQDLYSVLGKRVTYMASDVLAWLGY
jgi:hypothetical protein